MMSCMRWYRLINLKWYSRSLSKGIYNFNLISSLTKVKASTWFSQDADSVLCIGTDIETGKQVLLNKGNLAQAIIAFCLPITFSNWNRWKVNSRRWCYK
jgi:predicted acylesterase/phospholipase RssA